MIQQHFLCLAMIAITSTMWSADVWAQSRSTPTAGRENVVGFVMELSGKWVLDGEPPRSLVGGDELPSGASIRPEKADEASYIIVGLYNGKAERIKKATKLPEKEVASRVQRIWQAVMPRYRNGLATTVSRGAGLLQSGVVRQADEQLEMGPILSELPSGKWTVQLTQLPADASAAQVHKLQIEWDVDSPESAMIAAPGVPPGLYELSLLGQRSGRPVDSPSVILIAGPDDYAAHQAAFAEAVKLTESWDEQTQAEVSDRFLQAFLQSRVEPTESSSPDRE